MKHATKNPFVLSSGKHLMTPSARSGPYQSGPQQEGHKGRTLVTAHFDWTTSAVPSRENLGSRRQGPSGCFGFLRCEGLDHDMLVLFCVD